MTLEPFTKPKNANMPPALWLVMDPQLNRRPSDEKASALLTQANGKVDIIGDIHGHMDRLSLLLKKLDWTWTGADIVHPDPQRKLVLLGDLIDGGEYNMECLRLGRTLMETGKGTVMMGNHDWQLLAWAKGIMPDPPHNGTMDSLVETWTSVDETEKAGLIAWLETLCESVRFHHPLMGVVETLHGAPAEVVPYMAPWLANAPGAASLATMFGLPYVDRSLSVCNLDWRPIHAGDRWTFYGHQPMESVTIQEKTVGVDIGKSQSIACVRLDHGLTEKSIVTAH